MKELDSDLHTIYSMPISLDHKLSKAKLIISIYKELDLGGDVKMLREMRDVVMGLSK